MNHEPLREKKNSSNINQTVDNSKSNIQAVEVDMSMIKRSGSPQIETLGLKDRKMS